MNRLRITACLSIAAFALVLLTACGVNYDDPAEIEEPAEEIDEWDFEEMEPAIEVTPRHISFPFEFSDEDDAPTASEILEVRNAGNAPLHIEKIELVAGDDHFTIADIFGADDDGSAILEAGADESVTVVVEFEDDSIEPATGAIEITSDDPSTPVTTVELSGNSTAPCIDVTTSSPLDFGSVAVGHSTTRLVTVQNCSLHTDLHIDDVDVADDDTSFALVDQTDDIDPLALYESASFLVEFAPDADGAHEGRLDIVSDSPVEPIQSVHLVGEGVDADCVVAEALGAPSSMGGDAVGFDDHVEVDGGGIVELTAEIVDDAGHSDLSYEWTLVERPAGSLEQLAKPDEGDTSLRVLSLGEYVVQLVVYDGDGVASCEPSTVHIVSTTDEEIHIQLTWISPLVEAAGGVDSSVQRGTDLDLHYVRPGGSWGDPFDSIYWQYSEQDWNHDGTQNARLYIDDLWGDDPENITHGDPEEGVHHVGVHVYRDYCWPPTDATVRVHFHGELVFEDTRRLYQTDNFWYVGDIDWSDDPEFVILDKVAEDHSLTSHWDVTAPASC